MTSAQRQYAVGIAFTAVVIVGLLVADGFFSSTWTLRHPITRGTSQLSTFGPPTRLDGANVVAEPLYVDARIPPWFDTVQVTASFLNSAYDPSGARIGVELPDGGLHFLPTTAAVSPVDAGFTLTASGDVSQLPVAGRRFRFVLSLPGVIPERPLMLTAFTVTAARN